MENIIEYIGWFWMAIVVWVSVLIAVNDTRLWRGRNEKT